MNQELRAKLENNVSSYKDITNQLSTPKVYSDRTLMKTLNQKLTKLEPGVKSVSYTHLTLPTTPVV